MRRNQPFVSGQNKRSANLRLADAGKLDAVGAHGQRSLPEWDPKPSLRAKLSNVRIKAQLGGFDGLSCSLC
jgi:hypothetical protein